MKRTLSFVLSLLLLGACDTTPEAGEAPPTPQLADQIPDSDAPDGDRAPQVEPADVGPGADSEETMTLRLPVPGTPVESVLERVPECRAEWESEEQRCRFHGWIRPLLAQCEGGCAWWTYRFVDGQLDTAEVERAVYDADAEYAARFADEAGRVAEELTRRFGAPSLVEELGRWESVESNPDGRRVSLERRVWTLEHHRATWLLSGEPGHHPGVVLNVRFE